MADTVDKLNERFGPVLESIQLNTLKQSSFLESIYSMSVVESIEQAKQISLLSDLVDIQKNILNLSAEQAERTQRQDELGDVLPPDRPGPGPGGEPTISEEPPEEFGLKGLLTAAVLAPYAFRFVKGFLGEMTDGLIELTPSSVLGALRLPAITGMFATLGKSFLNLEAIAMGPIGTAIASAADDIAKAGQYLSPIFDPIKNTFTAAKNLISGPLGNTLSYFTGGVSKILGLFGKLVWPFSIVLGVLDGVEEFRNTEGTMLERIGAGIGGFLGEIVGAPLDVLKSAVAWVLGKFGFDETSSAVAGFSFENTISDIVGGMFSVVQDMVDWVKTLFTDPTEALNQLWSTTLSGVASLTDLLYAPINAVINWVRGIFNWGDPNEEFRLQDEIINVFNSGVEWLKNKFKWSEEDLDAGKDFLVNLFNETTENIKAWFTDAFDFLPSVDDIKNYLNDLLPSWLTGKEESPNATLRRDLERQISEMEYEQGQATGYGYELPEGFEERLNALKEELANVPQGAKGGIFNMPESGSLAMLHGQEAVIPLDSAEGRSILARKTDAMISESTAMTTKPAPVIVRGGDSVIRPVNNTNNNNQTTIINNTVDPTRVLNHVPF